MEVSPFPFQGPLSPGDVGAARSRLVDDLVERISQRRVTALLGPRRYGKTSALREVRERLLDSSTVVWLDFYELSSWADLADRLDQALVDADVATEGRLATIAASVSVNLGMVKAELRRPVAERPDPMLTASLLIDVIVKLATSTPTTLIIDEFSGISAVDRAAGKLRTKLQHHYREIGLVFAGSEPSTMRMLFADTAQPFYAQADIVEIEPFSLADVNAIVRRGFNVTGRVAGTAPGEIYAFAVGHPQRTMQLADACWRITEQDGRGDDEVWAEALGDVRRASANGLERLFSSHASGEKLVLRLVANGDGIFGAAADYHELSHSSAQHARDVLLDRGQLEMRDDRLVVVDPIYGDWLRRRFG